MFTKFFFNNVVSIKLLLLNYVSVLSKIVNVKELIR